LRSEVSTTLNIVRTTNGSITQFPILNLTINLFAFTSLKIYLNNRQNKKLIFEKIYTENSFKSLSTARFSIINDNRNTATKITNNIITERITYPVNDSSLLGAPTTITYELGTPISSFNGGQVICSNPKLNGTLATLGLAAVAAPTPPPPRVDPLAQSFLVDQPTGVFVTGLDLYFQSKDTQLPVTVQLRSMSLGTPTETIYPFSEVTLTPNQVGYSKLLQP
jgi:hypothetical protein